MNLKNRFARRYHWMSEKFVSYVNDPRSTICCDYKNPNTLNLVSKKSNAARKVITDISKQNPDRVIKEYKKISTLNFPKREWIEPIDMKIENLKKVLVSTYETQPNDFENLLNIKGLGPKSIRALTLISELAYGTKADWSDPVKYSFSHGGKDGYPYPVDKENYDNSIDFLKKAIMKSKTSKSEKKNALLKLFEYQSQTDYQKLSH
jgi:hypothetical protein